MMPAPAVVAAGIAAREIAKRALMPAAKAGFQLAKKYGPKVFRAGKKQAKKAWNWLRKKWNDANKKFSKKKKACEPCKPAGNNRKRFTPRQSEIVKKAKRAKKTGISEKEAREMVKKAKESGLKARGPEAHQNRPHGKHPHIHVGPINHIPIK